jgi:hypothetical protein
MSGAVCCDTAADAAKPAWGYRLHQANSILRAGVRVGTDRKSSPADFSAGAGFGFRVLRGSGEMMFVLMRSPVFYLYLQVEPPFWRPPVFVPFAI